MFLNHLAINIYSYGGEVPLPEPFPWYGQFLYYQAKTCFCWMIKVWGIMCGLLLICCKLFFSTQHIIFTLRDSDFISFLWFLFLVISISFLHSRDQMGIATHLKVKKKMNCGWKTGYKLDNICCFNFPLLCGTETGDCNHQDYISNGIPVTWS